MPSFLGALVAIGVLEVVAGAPAASVTVNSTLVAHLSAVRLSFSDFPVNDTGVFFAVFYPADANTSTRAPLAYPATPPWTENAPAKWITCAEVPGCLSGAGSHDFILANAFTDARIVAFTGGLEKPVELAASPSIAFTDMGAPLRVHVSRTRDVSQMRAVWNTAALDAAQGVQWGRVSGAYTDAAQAQPRTYEATDMCAAPANSHGWFTPSWWNSALMTGLQPGTVYFYRVGSAAGGWSVEQSFRTAPAPGPHAAVSMLLFADMNVDEYDGTTVHWQVPDAGLTMQRMADRARGTGDGYEYTLAVHAGDISYATGYQAKWVIYDSRLEHSGLVNRVPYLLGQGNHERDVPGQGYFKTSADSGGECGVSTEIRYPGPEPTMEMQQDGWWALAHGSVFVVMLNSELEIGAGSDQFDFFVGALAGVNRSVTPWVLVFLHRPIYFVEGNAAGGVRDAYFAGALEPTLLKYKVDFVFVGHVHNAFASAGGIYDSKPVAPPAPGAYAAPIHACIGNAGMGLSGINATHPPAWAEWQMNAYGYSDLTAFNETHLRVRFFDDETDTLQHTISVERTWPRDY